MDQREIDSILDNLPEWASYATMNQLAAESKGTINRASISAFVSAVGKDKTIIDQTLTNLKQDLQKLNQEDAIDYESLSNTISGAFTGAFSTGGIKGLYDYMRNDELKGAVEELERGISARQVRLGALAATETGVIMSRGLKFGAKALGWVAIAAETVMAAVGKHKELGPMIDRGMIAATNDINSSMQWYSKWSKQSMGSMEAMNAVFDIASTSLTSLAGSSLGGGKAFAGFMKAVTSDGTMNYGFLLEDLGRFFATEVDILTKLGALEDISQLRSQQFLKAFDTANKMALGMAKATGMDRSRMLEERNTFLQSIDFQEAYVRSAQFYMDNYGADTLANMKNSMASVAMYFSATGLDENFTKGFMDTMNRSIGDIQFGGGIATNASEDFLAIVSTLPNGEELLSFMEDLRAGKLTEVEAVRGMNDIISQIKAEGKFMQGLSQLDENQRTLLETIMALDDTRLTELGNIDEEKLKGLGSELEKGDAGIDLENTLTQAGGTWDSFTDMSYTLSRAISEMWASIMQFLGKDWKDDDEYKNLLKGPKDLTPESEKKKELTPEERKRYEELYAAFTGDSAPGDEAVPRPDNAPDIRPVTKPTREEKSAPIDKKESESEKKKEQPVQENKKPKAIDITDEAKARQQAAMDFFIGKGLTPAQAAGLVGNFMVESYHDLRPDAVGDGGKAFGIAQWRYDKAAGARAKTFEEQYGKHVKDASFEEQLEYVMWEFENTHYKRAFADLKQATTPEEAAFIVDKKYEQSNGKSLNKRQMNAYQVHLDYEARLQTKIKEPEFNMEDANRRLADLKASKSTLSFEGYGDMWGEQEDYTGKIASIDAEIIKLQKSINEHLSKENMEHE